MQQVGLNERKCGTCRWWQGDREIKFWLRKPFKVECGNQGDCPATKSSNKSPRFSCPRWVKWEKLP